MASKKRKYVDIPLKLRQTNISVTIPVMAWQRIMKLEESKAKSALWELFSSYTRQIDDNEVAVTIHDKYNLESILKWQPPEGTSFASTAAFILIYDKIADINDTKECIIRLKRIYADKLFERISSDDFKVNSTDAFNGFVFDFCEAGGYELIEEEIDDDVVSIIMPSEKEHLNLLLEADDE